MRVLIQRVSFAGVSAGGVTAGEIAEGLCVFVGIGRGDTASCAGYLADKTANLRIFEDGQKKMNRSLLDVGGAALVISQFTLYADCKKGRRPSFTGVVDPDTANGLYLFFAEELERLGVPVRRGIFQEDMRVSICNEGPVTIMLEYEGE